MLETPGPIKVDMSCVEMCDSEGFQVVTGMARMVRHSGRPATDLHIRPSPVIKRYVDLGLSKVVTLEAS